MSMRYRTSAPLLGAVLVLAFGASPLVPLYAQTASEAAPASAPGGLLQVGEISGTATVVSIDAANNAVTLRGDNGKQETISVDPAVGNVSKLAPGDKLDILYREAVLLRADKVSTKGIRSRVETVATSPASEGVVAKARAIQVVATVQKIDHKNRKVTLRGPRHTVVVAVPQDVPIGSLKVGDSIRADYVGATAVQVTRNGQRVE
ncbi:hypothetical protein C7401_104355 [Paraburkholderia unamae]|uniref:hypothetical protein n=1 Tax=Paraburkholderia unamae TaxID=219649 RepID=UPI000DC52C79|nr:hypothetical protein [Paraburkholderia unamae]RAR65239.1 hypothetical protein C7401_104355 [Paraburkholderia unamae]